MTLPPAGFAIYQAAPGLAPPGPQPAPGPETVATTMQLTNDLRCYREVVARSKSTSTNPGQ